VNQLHCSVRPTLTWLGAFVLACCAVAALPVTSNAAPVTIAFTAQVNWMEDRAGILAGRIGVGDAVTGWYTYDSDQPDDDPRPSVAEYWYDSAPYGISLSINGYNFRTDWSDVEFIVSVGDMPRNDSYAVISHRNVFDISAATSDPPIGEFIELLLHDFTGTAHADATLPTPPLLDRYPAPWRQVVLHSLTGTDDFVVYAELTSMTLVTDPAPVPEPTTLALLLTGLAGSAIRSRRRR
jgi:hypothetical protein